MLHFLLGRSLVKRFGHGIPVVELLLAADVALLAGRHVARLDRVQRRRLIALLRQAHGRPSKLDESERRELAALVAILEPRLLFGSAVKRLSPVPLPKRLLYGARGSAARLAVTGRGRRRLAR